MGLTAIPSTQILDIMSNDFYEKYEEYRTVVAERKDRTMRQTNYSLANVESHQVGPLLFKFHSVSALHVDNHRLAWRGQITHPSSSERDVLFHSFQQLSPPGLTLPCRALRADAVPFKVTQPQDMQGGFRPM